MDEDREIQAELLGESINLNEDIFVLLSVVKIHQDPLGCNLSRGAQASCRMASENREKEASGWLSLFQKSSDDRGAMSESTPPPCRQFCPYFLTGKRAKQRILRALRCLRHWGGGMPQSEYSARLPPTFPSGCLSSTALGVTGLANTCPLSLSEQGTVLKENSQFETGRAPHLAVWATAGELGLGPPQDRFPGQVNSGLDPKPL